jgi:hypothetical protein
MVPAPVTAPFSSGTLSIASFQVPSPPCAIASLSAGRKERESFRNVSLLPIRPDTSMMALYCTADDALFSIQPSGNWTAADSIDPLIPSLAPSGGRGIVTQDHLVKYKRHNAIGRFATGGGYWAVRIPLFPSSARAQSRSEHIASTPFRGKFSPFGLRRAAIEAPGSSMPLSCFGYRQTLERSGHRSIRRRNSSSISM